MDPILERTFFRSGADAGRGCLGTVVVLLAASALDGLLAGAVLVLLRGAGRVAGGFLASAEALGPVRGLGAAGLVVLGRPGLIGAVPLLFVRSAGTDLGRLNSVGDFAEVVFLASAGFTSFFREVSRFGVTLGLGADVPAVLSLAAAGLAFTAERGVVTDVGGFLSGVFTGLLGLASFVSLGVAALAALPRGRFGVAVLLRVAGAGLLTFLGCRGVVETGFLGLGAARGLPLGVAAALDGVAAAVEAFTFFSGLAGSSLVGGAVMSLPAVASSGAATISDLPWSPGC